MKKTIRIGMLLVLALALSLSLIACKTATSPWENATYKTDAELGEGTKTVSVEVQVEDNVVVFTIHTDEETVGAALTSHGLLDGDMGDFGLYVKVVNGMTADYDVDGSYWAFYVNGEYAMTGVDTTPIAEQDRYSLVYTR